MCINCLIDSLPLSTYNVIIYNGQVIGMEALCKVHACSLAVTAGVKREYIVDIVQWPQRGDPCHNRACHDYGASGERH